MSLLVFLALTNGVAATITTVNDAVIINGTLSEIDYEKLHSILSTNPKIDIVIFQNCMGGSVSAGYKIAQLIRAKQLQTVAKNQCQSSCAYAFLAGKKRRFDTTPGVHLILLHASRNADPNNDVAPIVNPALMRYLSYLTDNKLTPPVKNLIERSTFENQGVVFMQANYMFFSIRRTVYCDGSEHGDVGRCQTLENVDSLAQGVVTVNN